MNKLIIVFLLLTSATFSQKIEIGNQENQLKVYNYFLENFHLVKNFNSEELIYVNLTFNNYQFIEKATYFSCTSKNRSDEQKTEIQIPYELNEYIKNSFSFFSSDIFFNKNSSGGSYAFYIPLNKDHLKIAIKELEAIIEEDHKGNNNSDKIGIVSNAKFEIQINNLIYNRNEIKNKIIESKLNELNSELIEIAPNLYLIFRIIKTKQFRTNLQCDYIEYKIMCLNGTFSKSYAWNRDAIFNSEEIEIQSNLYTEGRDSLTYTDTNEAHSNLEYELKIKFER